MNSIRKIAATTVFAGALCTTTNASAEGRFGVSGGVWDSGPLGALSVGAYYSQDFSQHIGLEGGAQYYTEDDTGLVEVDGYGFTLTVNGYLPLSDNTRLIGQLGGSYIDAEASVSFGGTTVSGSDSDAQLMWGAGGEWQMSDQWTARLMYQGHDTSGDSFNTYALSLGVRF